MTKPIETKYINSGKVPDGWYWWSEDEVMWHGPYASTGLANIAARTYAATRYLTGKGVSL